MLVPSHIVLHVLGLLSLFSYIARGRIDFNDAICTKAVE